MTSRRIATLLYHDLVEAGREDASGFAGGAAGLYKLSVSAFADHLVALEALRLGPPELAGRANAASPSGWMLHFDDGGTSALEWIAPRLESLGWRGHFFIPVQYIGTSGFLGADGVRELHRRGHVVGSHSWSHPERISALPYSEILREWKTSREALESMLGEAVTVASVPGGFYSPLVAQAAAAAGVRLLFNSEPALSPVQVAGIEVRGRFNVNRRTRPSTAAGLALGRLHLRASQYLLWNAKKAAKNVVGPLYRSLRETVLGR